MSQIEHFMLHNDRGDALPAVDFVKHLLEWRKTHSHASIFGPVIRHTWQHQGTKFERPNPQRDVWILTPDRTGFAVVENATRCDNLVLLNAQGKERMRISIPWKLTQHPVPASDSYPSHFLGPTSPWNNPETGAPGRFALHAWVEYAGDYAFELDWRTGQFLWGYHLERY